MPLLVSAADKTDPKKRTTYKQDEVMTEAENFFGKGAKGIADVIQKAFKDQGEPNAFIAGEEAGGAVGVGVRYGKGTLKSYGGGSRPDLLAGTVDRFRYRRQRSQDLHPDLQPQGSGARCSNASRVSKEVCISSAAPGLNYARTDGITVAPVRLGVGWRQGASVSYIHFTQEKCLA